MKSADYVLSANKIAEHVNKGRPNRPGKKFRDIMNE